MRVSFCLVLFLPFIMSLSIYAESPSANQLCQSHKKVPFFKKPNTKSDLIHQMDCYRKQFRGNRRISNLAKNIVKIVRRVPSEGWRSDSELAGELEGLADQINSKVASSERIKYSQDNLGLALKGLMDNYGNKTKRRRLNSRGKKLAYIESLKNVMRLTRSGREVLQCYDNETGGLLSGRDEIIFNTDLSGARFRPMPDEQSPGKYKKQIIINPEDPPLSLLRLFAHEMKHGCKAKVHAANKDSFMACRHNLDNVKNNEPSKIVKVSVAEAKLTVATDEYVHEAAVDEMRAYSTDAGIMKELAHTNPDLLCNTVVGSRLTGNVLGHSHFSYQILDEVRAGDFPHNLIAIYNKMGAYKSKVVYETDGSGNIIKDGNGKPIIRRLLRERIEKNGFYVK